MNEHVDARAVDVTQRRLPLMMRIDIMMTRRSDARRWRSRRLHRSSTTKFPAHPITEKASVVTVTVFFIRSGNLRKFRPVSHVRRARKSIKKFGWCRTHRTRGTSHSHALNLFLGRIRVSEALPSLREKEQRLPIPAFGKIYGAAMCVFASFCSYQSIHLSIHPLNQTQSVSHLSCFCFDRWR